MGNDFVYLDTASVGIVSDATLKAGTKFNDLLTRNASEVFYNFAENDLPFIRKELATFMGAQSKNLAFVPNFSFGFNAVVHSIKKQHKRVLLYRSDYPSLFLPFVLNDFEVTWLESPNGFSWPLELVKETIVKNKIEIFAISHVQYLTGFKSDLKALAEICKKHNVIFLVDASQSLGSVALNFDEIGADALLASNYKWMNAGFGSAVLCLKADFIDRFKSTIAGYSSMTFGDGNVMPNFSITNYEPGHLPLEVLLRLRQAVKEKVAFGIENIEKSNQAMAKRFVDGLNNTRHELIGPMRFENRSSMICVKAEPALHQSLLKAGIKTMYRNHSLRIAFHHTNTNEDVDALLSALK